MATKKKVGKKARKKKGPPFGDSPIFVGGGGGIGPWVEMEFDHNEYVPDPEDRDNYISTQQIPEYVLVDRIRRNLPPKCKIVIEFSKGSSTRRITVQSDPPSKPLGVKFKGSDLPYNHQQRKHRDDGSTLKRVKITIEGETTTYGLTEDSKLEVHTIDV